jgi:adenine phosphoribosyltransferase
VGFKKEYGEDFFQMQGDAVEKGHKVLVVDDIIATGMSHFFFSSLIWIFFQVGIGDQL